MTHMISPTHGAGSSLNRKRVILVVILGCITSFFITTNSIQADLSDATATRRVETNYTEVIRLQKEVDRLQNQINDTELLRLQQEVYRLQNLLNANDEASTGTTGVETICECG